MRESFRLRTKALFLAVCLHATGCAVVEPRLGPDAAKVTAYNTNPNLPNAIAVAESLRDIYAEKVDKMLLTERVSGLALIGAATLAADLAIRSVSESEVLGLGLGGAALYTGAQFLVSKPQEYIYAAGATAVQCALDAMHPLRIAYAQRGALEQLIKDIDLQTRDLDAVLAAIPDTVRTAPVLRARALSQEAKGVLPLAREALVVLDNSGGELRSSVASIQGQVTTAIISSSPSLQGLRDALGSALPALGARITAVPMPPARQGLATSSSGSEEALLKPLIAKLETSLAAVQPILTAVRARPSAEKMRACSVDLQQAGLTMRVQPTGDVTVQAGSSGVTVSVTGGILPYQQASWIGTAPSPDQVELTTETGAGLINIVAAAGSPAGGPYVLLIRDAAQGRETVNITVTAGTQISAESSCTPNANVRTVQQRLIAKGITNVQVDGMDRTLSGDGCMGPITVAAMRRYLSESGAIDSAIPTDPQQLLSDVAQALEDELEADDDE